MLELSGFTAVNKVSHHANASMHSGINSFVGLHSDSYNQPTMVDFLQQMVSSFYPAKTRMTRREN
jgi:hypothetical protein